MRLSLNALSHILQYGCWFDTRQWSCRLIDGGRCTAQISQERMFASRCYRDGEIC